MCLLPVFSRLAVRCPGRAALDIEGKPVLEILEDRTACLLPHLEMPFQQRDIVIRPLDDALNHLAKPNAGPHIEERRSRISEVLQLICFRATVERAELGDTQGTLFQNGCCCIIEQIEQMSSPSFRAVSRLNTKRFHT
ncbi:hypothetical protein KSF_107030 [Reticulibacter mediterranei]|uniref:Uncharacterized protein n=1 Tax=Reticulibacter mediterranei TaxID=2778369 RepID=A0A8J3IY74_9CHLR|nr:hypothetical protein KSF_107030 [Reticulibacter mediterranei]